MATNRIDNTPIHRNYILLMSGSILLILSGILNIIDQVLIGWSYRIIPLRYVLFCFTVIGLIPIAIGLRNLTEMYFIEHITLVGRQASLWLLFYSVSVVLDLVLIGWPITAPFVGYAVIFGRILGFLKLNRTFTKIKDIFDLKIGSIFYIIFAWYSVIISILNSIANWAQDISFEIGMFALKGLIETILLVLVGIKLIIDSTRLRKFILVSDIKPYSTKRTLFVKDSSTLTRSKLGKEHLQAQTQLEKLREKSKKRTIEVKPKRRKKKEVKITEDTLLIDKKKIEDVKEIIEDKFKVETSTKRTLTAKNEKIVQQIVITIALIAFTTYAFVTSNATLILYSWIIIAIFGTYLIVNYIVLFFVGRGFAITSIISDLAFLFIIIPAITSILSYFIFQGSLSFVETKLADPLYRSLFITTSAVLSIICIILVLRFKIRATGMNVQEYIRYRFDFKARAKEMATEKARAQKKRYEFDQLDRIEARMVKQKAAKVMDYEDFDFKERLKDLGSPLDRDEE